MTTDLKIELKDKQVNAAVLRLIAASHDLTPAMSVIASDLLAITQAAFRTEQNPATGAPWAPLSAVTLQRRAKSGSVHPVSGEAAKLQQEGDLLSSIVADYDRTSALAATNLQYATTQHYGAKRGEFGTGKYKTRKGSFPIPWGDIPPRPFFGLAPQHEDQITNLIARHIKDEFHG